LVEQAEFELRCGLKAALRPPWRAKASLRGLYGIDQRESRRLRLSLVFDASSAFIVNTYSPMDSATTGRTLDIRCKHRCHPRSAPRILWASETFECAKKLIQEAGYKGEKVVIIGKRSVSRALVIDIAP